MSTTNTVSALTTNEAYQQQLATNKSTPSQLLVVQFSATWHEPSQAMLEVLKVLATQHPNVVFRVIEAEELPDISTQYSVQSVPTFVFIKGSVLVDSLSGADASALTSKVAYLSRPPLVIAEPDLTKRTNNTTTTTTPTDTQGEKENPASGVPVVPGLSPQLCSRLHSLINQTPVIAFVKGSPSAPRCGFSKRLMSLFDQHHITYSHFDILSDNEVREGLKVYSNWPTYPQVYVKGELMGGLDVVTEMIESGEFPIPAESQTEAQEAQ